jgi:hypothetical protein
MTQREVWCCIVMAFALVVAAVALITDAPNVQGVAANSPTCKWTTKGDVHVSVPTPGLPAVVTIRAYEDGSSSVFPENPPKVAR